MTYAVVKNIIFTNKQNIPWDDVEDYLKDFKHDKEANGGWYRYDVRVIIPVEHNGNMTQNRYSATAVVRIKDEKLYLYDIINIKKEASTPL